MSKRRRRLNNEIIIVDQSVPGQYGFNNYNNNNGIAMGEPMFTQEVPLQTRQDDIYVV